MKNQQFFSVTNGFTIKGFSSAKEIYYAAVTPGAVVAQGKIPVVDGKFVYKFDPEAINKRIPIYDIENLRNGRKEIGRIVHLTLFAREETPDGTAYHSFARVIFRGTNAIYAH